MPEMLHVCDVLGVSLKLELKTAQDVQFLNKLDAEVNGAIWAVNFSLCSHKTRLPIPQ